MGALALTATLLSSPMAFAAHGLTTRVSVTSGDPGDEAQQPNGSPSISGDGRFVAFVSGDQLAPDDTNTDDDIYVRDRLNNTTTLLSIRSCGDPEDPDDECSGGDVWEPSISADGRYVAFTSDADDIHVLNVDNLWSSAPLEPQIFVHDVEAGETVLVTVLRDEFDIDTPVSWAEHGHPSLSEDGSLVAFRSAAFLSEDDGTDFDDVYLRAWQSDPPEFTLLTPRTCDSECDGGDAREPVISASGEFVAFTSAATDFESTPGASEVSDTNDHADVYLRDIAAETTEIVSLDDAGSQRPVHAEQPTLSADGSRVAFFWHREEAGVDVAIVLPTVRGDIFVRDRAGATTIPVSVNLGGLLSQTWAGQPAISGNGLFVAFTSSATDLVEAEEPVETPEPAPFEDVFVRDLAGETTQQVSVASDDSPGDGPSSEPSISADGLVVAFSSDAENLVVEDDNGEPDVFVHDRGQPPVVLVPSASLSPDPVDFGEHLVGTTADPITVTVLSTGSAALVVTDVLVAGTDLADFAIDDTDCIAAVLPFGSLCTVDVTFTPSAAGPRAALLQVTDNAADSPQMVSLLGVGTEPALDVTPAAVDFGNLPLGVSSGDHVVTAMSVGTGPVTITDVALGGPHPGDFSATAACNAVTLDPGAMCQVLVAFTPSTLGLRNAQLTFAHTGADSPVNVTLRGRGVHSGLMLTPDPVDFGEQLLGVTAGPLVATVLNIGQVPVTVNTVTVEGLHAADFSIDDLLCAGVLLLPGGGCMVAVFFTPDAPGVRAASLVVASTDPASPHSVTLTGAAGAVLGPAVEVSPDVTDFREVLLGATSPAGQLTVSSVGTLPATVTELAVEGDAGEFALSDDGCTGTVLAPGEECTVTVTFSPAEPGLRTATVGVHHDAPDSPQRAELRGTGLEPLLELDPSLGRRGFVTTAVGTDFPPLAEVTLAWDRGIGRFTVTADTDGSFRLVIVVLRRDRLGPRTLEATGEGFTADADYLVVPGPVFPPKFVTRS